MAASKTLIPAALAAALMAAPLSARAEVKAVDLITGVINAQIQSELTRMQESQVWEAAAKANTAQAYRNYLKLYPNGPHVAQANARLKAMGVSVAASGAAQVEADLGLTRADRTRIQSQLTAKGYSTNGVDGSFGAGTRRAIATWQRDTGRSVTGYLTAAEIKVLNVGGGSQPVVDDSGSSDAAAAARVEYNLGLTRADRVMVQQQLAARGYKVGTPDGIFGSGTRAAIAAWQRAGNATATGYLTAAQVNALRAQGGTSGDTASTSAVDRARIEEGLLSLSRDERATIQRQLTALGYDTRGADGIFGGGTRTAIQRWQTANKLTATGYLDADQLIKLRGQAGGSASTPPVETEASAWAAARSKNTVAAYRAYLDAWPRGANAENARQRIEALGGPSDAQLEAWKAGEAALGMDATTRTLVETRLANAGYNPGRADGTFDASTRTALKAYQKAKGLPQTGYMNQGTAVSLMSDVFK